MPHNKNKSVAALDPNDLALSKWISTLIPSSNVLITSITFAYFSSYFCFFSGFYRVDVLDQISRHTCSTISKMIELMAVNNCSEVTVVLLEIDRIPLKIKILPTSWSRIKQSNHRNFKEKELQKKQTYKCKPMGKNHFAVVIWCCRTCRCRRSLSRSRSLFESVKMK